VPRSTAGSSRTTGKDSKRQRNEVLSALAQRYRRFAEVEAAKISPLYERIALAVSESDEALRAIETAPARKRHPALILAALNNLALSGQAPTLADAYKAVTESEVVAGSKVVAASEASADTESIATDDSAVDAAIRTLVEKTDVVVAVVSERKVHANAGGNHAVLYPAIAEVARRVGVSAIGLIDVGCSAGFNLNVDRAGIAYSNGQSLGDPSSPVQVPASVVGDRPIPTYAMPEVVARIGIDLEPIDSNDADEARWLHACLPPDQPERIARLEGELELAASAPPFLMQGDMVDLLPEALAQVPADALPVVTTTWALSDLPLETRLRFLQRLDGAATERPVAWVSVEGVGVAPAIPTFGDRPASGHSIIGVAVFNHSTLNAEAAGRCWLRGQMLAWLTDSWSDATP
jgi:hypothetical protein